MIRTNTARLVAAPATAARPCVAAAAGHGYQWRVRVGLCMNESFMNDITSKRSARRLGKQPT